MTRPNYSTWDQSLKLSTEALITQLYANRKFEQKNKKNHRSHLVDIMNYMDLENLFRTPQDDQLKLLRKLTINTKLLDFFEKNIRIVNARLEVYITTKKDLDAYQLFCERLAKIYSKEALSTVILENSSWEHIEAQIKNYKRQKGVPLVIHNQHPKGKNCQYLIGTLFLACLYRCAQHNVK